MTTSTQASTSRPTDAPNLASNCIVMPEPCPTGLDKGGPTRILVPCQPAPIPYHLASVTDRSAASPSHPNLFLP